MDEYAKNCRCHNARKTASVIDKNVWFVLWDRVNNTSTWYDRVISYRCTKIIEIINVQWNWYKIVV